MPEWKSEVRRRIAGLKIAPAREAAIVEELAQHLEDYCGELLAAGVAPAEAERRALAQLCGPEALRRELHRVERRVPQDSVVLGTNQRRNMIADLWQDFRYAARALWKNPGFTLIATGALALGIGANTAIFSAVDRLLMRTLPVNEPEQLVNLSGRGEQGGGDPDFNWPTYLDYREQNDVLSGLIAFKETPMNLSDGGQSERITGALVSGNYFDVLGVTPALGRAFLPEEDRTPGTHPVAVLSYGLWQRRFGADPKLVGRAITLNTFRFTVIGIAPAEFRGVRRGITPDVYVPAQMLAQAWPTSIPGGLNDRHFTWANLMGRLKPGISRAQAQASLTALAKRIAQSHPNTTYPVVALTDGSQGETEGIKGWRTPLKLLMATVALVLLIACVNVANLLLARAATRRRELAVRLAVGASRSRLIRQLMTESLLLSLMGAALGLLLAVWMSGALAAYGPPTGESANPPWDARLDWRALSFTMALSLLTSLLFGLLPAWKSSNFSGGPNLTAALKEEGGGSGSPDRIRFRSALVSAQLALSLIVLVCAGLCVRSLQNLQKIDAGFEAAKVLVMGIDLSLSGYKEAQGQQFFNDLLERVSALPGVESASLAHGVPLSGNRIGTSVGIEGYTPTNKRPPAFGMNMVGPRYCATLKLPLLAGRDFTEHDTANSLPVVIINSTAARLYFPNQNPLGKHLYFFGPPGQKPPGVEIVGVVGDSHYRSLTDAARPSLLLPASQRYEPSLSLHLRTAGAPTVLTEAVRSIVRGLDPHLPVTNVRTLAEQRDNSIYSERMTALLLSAFGGLALLLAAMGIYGVMAYAVTQRTREIGIRMALGAQRADVLRLIFRQGGWLVIAGVVIGTAGAFAATRYVKSVLYEVSVTDPLTFALAPLILAGVAILACWIPARRATKVDPLESLRCE
jgi:predicted permease